MPFDKNTVDIVLYHSPCPDGYGSAFVVWNYLKRTYGIERAEQVKYIGCRHNESRTPGDEFYQNLVGKNVLMCDFSYSLPIIRQIIDSAASFLVLDHHKSAEDNLCDLEDEYKIFDMKRSGVGITWDFYFPNEPLPDFLAFIQDRDLWKYELADTARFTAFFHHQPSDFSLWETYLQTDILKDAIITGGHWLAYRDELVGQAVKNASYVIQEINNQYCIVLYVNNMQFKSEIGSELFKRFPDGDFSCIWHYDLFYDKTVVSLRSTDERMSVIPIAQDHQGGGHRNASGGFMKGCNGSLNYPIVKDGQFLQMLINRKRRERESVVYLLDCKTEFQNRWDDISCKYLDLLVRKCPDADYFVFVCPSGKHPCYDTIEYSRIELCMDESSIMDHFGSCKGEISD
jgi:uncharacterized protein